jgi:hypothetical protein
MRLCFLIFVLLFTISITAQARDFTSNIGESSEIVRIRPEYKVPDEPGQLFYVERYTNSNTVVYVARLDAQGNIDRADPVEAFWRWFNVDGHKKPLNFMERMMAYGVTVDRAETGKPITFNIAALPERKLTLILDAQKKPEALMQIGGHIVKLAYVYLNVVESGLMPSVPALDIFGTDTASGKAVHEHLIQK